MNRTMLRELDTVVLTKDIPEAKLTAGDMGAIVHAYTDGQAFEVEVVSLTGETVAIVTLPADAVRAVAEGEIPHARKLDRAVV
jgi:Domain of unknown function (DUF4926)